MQIVGWITRRAGGWLSRPLSALVAEIVAEQGAAPAPFTELGFTGEALLADRAATGRVSGATSWYWPTTCGTPGPAWTPVGVADELRSTGSWTLSAP